MDLREIQRRLAAMGLYDGAIDGMHGAKTRAAMQALFLSRPVLKGDWRKWSPVRRGIAAGQLLCLVDGIEVGAIDGLKGPQTRHAFEVYLARARGIEAAETWRDQESEIRSQKAGGAVRGGIDGNSPVFGCQSAADWPRQLQSEMERCFGPVGANQSMLQVPRGYPMRLAWDLAKPVTRFSCHERLHDPVRRVLERVLDHYGPARIKKLGLDRFGGCLNVRRMRGGSAWSTHAWGAALDFDPERNQLKWDKRRARFARPEYDAWWTLWEAEGFVSLGRAKDFDWMHVQAARL